MNRMSVQSRPMRFSRNINGIKLSKHFSFQCGMVITGMFRMEQIPFNHDVASIIIAYTEAINYGCYLFPTISILGRINVSIGNAVMIDTSVRESDSSEMDRFLTELSNPWVDANLDKSHVQTSYDQELRKSAEIQDRYRVERVDVTKPVKHGWVNLHLKDDLIKRRMNTILFIGNMGHLNDKLAIEISKMVTEEGGDGCGICIGLIDSHVLTGGKRLNHEKLDEWCYDIVDKMDRLVGMYQDNNIPKNIDAITVGNRLPHGEFSMTIKGDQIKIIQSNKFNYKQSKPKYVKLQKSIGEGDILTMKRNLNSIVLSFNGKSVQSLYTAVPHDISPGRTYDRCQGSNIYNTSNLIGFISYESSDLVGGNIKNWMKLTIKSTSYIDKRYKDVLKRKKDIFLTWANGFDL